MNPLFMFLALLGSALGLAGGGGGGKSAVATQGKLATPTSSGPVTDGGDVGGPGGNGGSGPTAPNTDDDAPTGDPDSVIPPVQPGGSGSGVSANDPDQVVNTPEPVDVLSGRVTTLLADAGDVASVRVISGPAHGNVTVNPDNSLALVLTGTDHTGALDFSYELTRTDGSTETVQAKLNVIQGPVLGGWGLGNFYTLETDENGESVIEWGENHRDVFVSGSDDALTLADIAALEGLPVDQITGGWLAANPEYGGSEGMALAQDAAASLWTDLVRASATEPASHWLRLEAGYEYTFDKLLRPGITGESELHPIHITSYGVGEKPLLTEMPEVSGAGAKNIVFSNVEFGEGVRIMASSNVLFENVTSRGDDMVLQTSSSITVRNSAVFDVKHEQSVTPNSWDPADNRISGVFSGRTTGLLMENNLFDHNGWGEGYDPGMSLSSPQPPSIFSHNVYLSTSVTDVTFRDNVTMRAASFGVQFRGGGFVEDNVFLDNNGAVFVAGGPKDGEYYGNYSLYADNVVTSGGHRIYGGPNGQLTGGIGDYSPLTSLVDNIVAHLADPDNAAELASKTRSEFALKGTETSYYNDTIVYNWAGAGRDPDSLNLNLGDLDTNVLDTTTIQRFTAQLLGQETATISDLAAYLRASAQGAFDGMSDAQMIVDFFQAGFGLMPDIRVEAETLRFVPNDLADGVRWDNRLNWSTDDLPGSVAGDSVDLAGNWVIYGGTSRIENLDFGDNGRLAVTHGRLDVNGDVITEGRGGHFAIDNAGQVWINGYDGEALLDINVDGGRFANTGAVDGRVDLRVTDGQALLATEGARFDLENGSLVEIVGGSSKVGFEGTDGGTAVMRIENGGILEFEAANGELGQISEFRSGANGAEAVNVNSGINFGEGTLRLDLNGLAGNAGDFTLVSVDEMVGAFSNIDITGLSATRDARLVFDYNSDQVILRLGQEGAGSGQMNFSVLGDQMDAQANAALWAALTSGQPVLGDQMPEEVTLDDEALNVVQ